MRSTFRDEVGAIGVSSNKLPKGFVIDYGSVPSTSGGNTYINFNQTFAQNPIVLFSVNCAWNADPGARLVGLSTTQAIIVVNTSGTLYWMALGFDKSAGIGAVLQTLEEDIEPEVRPVSE